jgi:hypothetical protein
MYSNIKLIYINPVGLELPSEIIHEITGKGTIEQVTSSNLEMVSPIRLSDISYFFCVGHHYNGRFIRYKNTEGEIHQRRRI